MPPAPALTATTGGFLPPHIRSRIVRYLLLHWRPDNIAEEVHCHIATVYRIQENLFVYGSAYRPQFRPKGAPRVIHDAAAESLAGYIERQPWAMQKEMVWYLWEEWGINVHRATISRTLKRLRLSHKLGQRVGYRQNEELRLNWIADLLHTTAEQLVFVDETMFNETTGWRHMVYAPVGEPGRYHADPTRGQHWSVLPAYTVDGYLPCTGFKQGWFNAEAYFRWIADELLPHCNTFPAPRSVIVMDNASIHCNRRIKELIAQYGCEVRFLPSYSLDFNPIELSFSVLKAWVRRYFHELWPQYDGSFGDFLRYAVRRSRCDRFAVEHFRYSSMGMVIFEVDIREFERAIDERNVQIDFDDDV